MTTRAGVRLLAIASLGCASVALLAQETAVSSLTVRIAPKTVQVAVVTIENTSAAILSNFEVEFTAADGRVANVPRRSNAGVSLRGLNNNITFLQPGKSLRWRFVTPETFVPTTVRLTHVSAFYLKDSGSFGQNEGDQAILDDRDDPIRGEMLGLLQECASNALAAAFAISRTSSSGRHVT
jgi:hypothetical protein